MAESGEPAEMPIHTQSKNRDMARGNCLRRDIGVFPEGLPGGPGYVITLLPILLFSGAVFASEDIREVAADPAKGFHWPYYLVVPSAPVAPTFLVVEPNNSGTGKDDPKFHRERARTAINRRASDAGFRTLGSPYLIPAFPRPMTQWKFYTHALDRDTLQAREPGLERIDLQLIAMIQDARRRLSESGIRTEARIFLWGYSAAGAFTIRFTILHPELVQAASLGGCSLPTIPLSQVNGRRLRYPIGIADLKELAGRKFQARAFRAVPIQIFRGDADDNDEVAYDDGYDPEDRQLINTLFGGPPPILRYPAIQRFYRSSAPRARFIIEPGVAHNDTLTRKGTAAFFAQHRAVRKR